MSHFKQSGRLSGVFNRAYATGKLLPSMKEPFRVFPSEPVTLAAPSFASKTLASGTQVAVETRPGQLFTTISFFVNSGSRFETSSTSGSTHLLKRLAFASTKNQTSFRLVRDLEAIAANLTVNSGRETTQYTVDVLPENVDTAIAILSDIILNPKFAAHEVSDEVEVLRQEIEDMKATTPAAFLVDAAYSAAFSSEGLGRPLIASAAALDSLDAKSVKSFHEATFQPSRVAVVARGSNVDGVFDSVQKHFSGAASGAATASASKYYGGEARLSLPYGATEFSVSFRGVGFNSSDVYAQAVLKSVLGGGKNYYTGEGTGYGFTSRINENIVTKHSGVVVSSTAFQTPYSDAGLFGFHTITKAGAGGQVAKALAQEINRVKAGDITEDEVSRAKTAVKAAVLFASDSSSASVTDVGVQLLNTKTFNNAAAVSAKVDAVTSASVKQLAAAIFSSPATLATLGDSTGIPHPSEFLN
eukprot:TRINITY_DN6051_c0_g1_i1.p1 TRINITY_DN6051_c0_g1~~TRINITY_DN6051_c0_g1_i1.p1  ORF type:complete len:472 (-),score=114.98 TRINITY_DN6051_c0_g1_i1:159-1574(-)